MLTRFSKWALYAVSYLPVYILLIIRLLFSQQENAESLLQMLSLNYACYSHIIISLNILFLLSIPVLWKFRRFTANERTRSRLVKNCTSEMASFFIPFILSLLTIGIDWYGWMICVVIFLLSGYIILQADWVHICPIFFYLNYRLYQAEDNSYVLSHLSLEQYNQLLLDNADGIEVKALTPKLYISIKNQF